MDRRSFCLGALAALSAATGVQAHPDHREGELFIDVLVSHGADHVDVLVRTPLDLLGSVGLPLTGASYVDVVAFREPDPIAGDGRTYEERAVAAVESAFRLEQDSTAVPLTVRSARLAPGDGSASDAFDTGRLTAAAEPADTERLVDAHRGFLDVHFTGGVGAGPLLFVPALGAGSTVTFRVAADGDEAPSMVSGSGELVPLARP